MKTRYAIVKTGPGATAQSVEAFLPGNYKVLSSQPPVVKVDGQPRPATGLEVLIGGVDDAGWTLGDYVLPRLASGLYFGDEVDGRNKVVKEYLRANPRPELNEEGTV